MFEENENLLKEKLGCNIGLLLEKMMAKETGDESGIVSKKVEQQKIFFSENYKRKTRE